MTAAEATLLADAIKHGAATITGGLRAVAVAITAHSIEVKLAPYNAAVAGSMTSSEAKKHLALVEQAAGELLKGMQA